MPDTTPQLYEGLFLLSQEAAASSLTEVAEHLTELLGRIDAEVEVIRKWDDRRLAYPIDGQKRGTYLLAYFKAQPTKLTSFERACNLSDLLARALVIKAEHIGETEMDLAKQEASASLQAKAPDERGDRGERPSPPVAASVADQSSEAPAEPAPPDDTSSAAPEESAESAESADTESSSEPAEATASADSDEPTP